MATSCPFVNLDLIQMSQLSMSQSKKYPNSEIRNFESRPSFDGRECMRKCPPKSCKMHLKQMQPFNALALNQHHCSFLLSC